VADPASFVETDGTDLVLDGEPFCLFGGNHPQLRQRDREAVDEWFDDWTEIAPITTLRVTAFGTGTDTVMSLQPEPGTWDERAFERLDYVIARAGEEGVRLVLPLTNYWEWQGGMPQYVEWADDASETVDFYTNEQCQRWYRDHIETVLTRENTVTGVEYRNDPTIAIWQLGNEPRPGNFDGEDDKEGFTDVIDRFVEWTGDISAYIKSLDDNHLVTTGLDRAPLEEPAVSEWYIDAHDHEMIDLWQTHVWAAPYHADLGIDGGVEWIENHAAAAAKLDKPAFVGEFGWNVPDDADERTDEGLQTRAEAIETWFGAIRRSGMAGGLVWDLRLAAEYTMGWNDFAVYPQEPHTPAAIARAGDLFAAD